MPLPIFSDVDLSRAVKRWTVRAFSGLASLLLSAWMEWRYPGVIGRWVDTATSSFWSFVSAPAPLGVVILLFALLIALVVGRHC